MWFSKIPRVVIIAPTYILRQWSTSTHWLVWLIWPKGTSKPEGKDFANASDYLETWDHSDSITAINAQKI